MGEAVIFRQLRHELGRTEIGEDELVGLAHGIGAVTELMLERALRRLRRRLEDGAVDVIEPAVIATADAAGADDAVFERHTAMAAKFIEQPDPAAAVAEDDEILAEDADRPRQVREPERIITGCQKRRRYSPPGVPGPTWWIG